MAVGPPVAGQFVVPAAANGPVFLAGVPAGRCLAIRNALNTSISGLLSVLIIMLRKAGANFLYRVQRANSLPLPLNAAMDFLPAGGLRLIGERDHVGVGLALGHDRRRQVFRGQQLLLGHGQPLVGVDQWPLPASSWPRS